MFKSLFKLFIILFLTFNFMYAEIKKKKVVYINSYHSGYSWSDSIQNGILDVFNIKQKNGILDFSNSKVELKIIEMDTKRNKKEEYKKRVSLEVKNKIDKYKPDLIITSDDNAAKYVIVPYFYNHKIPVIFSGVNADPAEYGFPTKNVTGMIETTLVQELIDTIRPYSKGTKIGLLNSNDFTSPKVLAQFEKILKQDIKPYFVNNKEEWKESYLQAQEDVDILFLGLSAAAIDFKKNYNEISSFVKKHTKIPSVSWDKITSGISVLTFQKIGEEQGEWAASRALEVLSGREISKINITSNKRANIFINTSLSKSLNIVWPFFLINDSVLVGE